MFFSRVELLDSIPFKLPRTLLTVVSVRFTLDQHPGAEVSHVETIGHFGVILLNLNPDQ